MMRRIGFVAAAASLALSTVLAGSASSATIDVSDHKIVCGTFIATAQISSPRLRTGGTKHVKIKISGTLDGCSVTDAADNPVAIAIHGRVSTPPAGLVLPTNDCATLSGTSAVTGKLRVTWSGSPSFGPHSSNITVTSVTGGTNVKPWATYGQLTLGVSGVTNAFAGTDGGASSLITAATGEDLPNLLAQCAASPGLHEVHLQPGLFQLQ